jgi:DNA-binding transcriptional LysR family regulator
VGRPNSFTLAADELGLPRAVLSRSITELEQCTHTPLLKRTTRHVSLAAEVTEYYEQCTKLIQQLEEAEQRLLERRASMSGKFRVIYHSIATGSGLWSAFARYKDANPEVELEIGLRTGPLNFAESSYDVAVFPQRLVSDCAIVSRSLFPTAMLLVASMGNLDEYGIVSSSLDLSGRLIVFTYLVGEMEDIVAGLAESTAPSCSCIPANAYVARDVAMSGEGLAWLPECMIKDELSDGRLEHITSADMTDKRNVEMAIQYRSRQLLPEWTRKFIEDCMSHINDSGTQNCAAQYDSRPDAAEHME